nr:DUF2939 domain-containing protein [Acinetobacter sp. Marseille-Q1620]
MKKILILFTVIILCYLMLWFVSPYWTLYKIKQAIDRNQPELLSEYIDYPSVRKSLKPQIHQQINKKIGIDHPDTTFERLGSSLTENLINHVIDIIVTPQSISLMLQGKALKEYLLLSEIQQKSSKLEWHDKFFGFVKSSLMERRAILSDRPSNILSLDTFQTKMMVENNKIKMRYLTMSKFEVIIPNDINDKTVFIFQRDGLNWKMVEILVVLF